MKRQPLVTQQIIEKEGDDFKATYFTAGKILEFLPMAFYACNAEGEIIEYNSKAVELWGRKPSKHEKESVFFAGIRQYLENDKPVIPYETPVSVSLKDGREWKDLEIQIQRPDSSQVILCESISAIKDGRGNIVGVVNTFNDITEKKQTGTLEKRSHKSGERSLEKRTADLIVKNEQLKFSEERYHKMIDEVVDYAIILLDRDGNILNWNKGAEKIKGYTQEEIAGKNFRIFYTDEDRKAGRPDKLMKLAIETGKAADEGWRVRKDGTKFWGSIVITALHDADGNVTGFSKVTRDLTERKMAEEELKRSEERYHRMVNEVEDYAIILLDPEGTVLNWNKGAEKIKGFKQEDIVGKNFRTFYTKEDQEKGRPNELLTQAYKTGKAADEGWRMRSDGSRFWGSIVITALHNKEGEIIGFSKVTRDLTEKKSADDKLREYSNALEFQNKELEQFAYAASHDMKEPLRKILLYNSFINENPANQLDAKSKEYLNRSLNAVHRMNELIENLLTYSKSTSNVESFEEANVNKLLHEIAQIYKEESGHRNMKIEVDHFPMMKVVPFQFRQLMDNLISNSIKYSHPDRDVEVKIKYELVSGVAIGEKEAEKDKNYHKISVTDNGIGFDSQYEEKVFEIFQRLSNPLGVKGSGIGLAICKKIVQNHKGFIKAKGKYNEGATFEIYLPVMSSDHVLQ
jgi:PAS domain S-box-containing protein